MYLWIEVLVAPEGVDRDGVGLQAVRTTGHGLLDQKAEKPLPPRTGAEGLARDDLGECLQYRGRRECGALRRSPIRRVPSFR